MATQRISEATRGVFAISATPFDEEGALDLESADSLTDFYVEQGVDGITILGMMGEAPKLTDTESLTLARRVLARINGGLPVIVGVSNPGIDNLVGFARATMDLGAAGIMVAPPAGLRTESQLLGYFDSLFERLGGDVPVCYQDYPTVTGVHISVETFAGLVERHPSLVMLKHEDFPGLRKLSAVRRAEDAGAQRRVSILVANAGLYYPLEMRRGADGVMTGFAYPEMLARVFALFESGDPETAEDLYDLYLPILRYEYQIGAGLAVRKEILRRRGAIRCAATRAPGPSLDADDHEELTVLMRRLESKLAAFGG